MTRTLLPNFSSTSAGFGQVGAPPVHHRHGERHPSTDRVWDSTCAYGGGWVSEAVFELRRRERDATEGSL